MRPIAWQVLGLCEYDRALRLQEHAWEARRIGGPDVGLALEHPPIITLGRRISDATCASMQASLAPRGVDCARADRGGEATYHGPGQLVLYPIVALGPRRLGTRAFIRILEQVMIDVAATFGVAAWRDARGPGVWAQGGKLGSVGIRLRESISTHGLALNVDLDLTPFTWIAPCGVPDLTMTSLTSEGAAAEVVDVLPRAMRILDAALAAAPSLPEEAA